MKNALFGLAVVFMSFGCTPISERKQPMPSLQQLASMDLKLDGPKLAEVYCGNCHLKPEPGFWIRKLGKILFCQI
ncbi:hypothetical protein [Algoriphagus hitonicola]|uniref:hypothetical protein n=1 Tax=Algoriphagus hitonicola TaxID=435880 RepID=UPI00361A44A2